MTVSMAGRGDSDPDECDGHPNSKMLEGKAGGEGEDTADGDEAPMRIVGGGGWRWPGEADEHGYAEDSDDEEHYVTCESHVNEAYATHHNAMMDGKVHVEDPAVSPTPSPDTVAVGDKSDWKRMQGGGGTFGTYKAQRTEK